MVRTIFGLLGAVAALVPGLVSASYERLALADPEECATNEWVVPGIRAAGVGLAVCCARGGRRYAWLMNLFATTGVFSLCFPRQYVAFATGIACEEPEAVTWRGGLVPAVRTLGALHLLLAGREATRRRNAD